MKVLIAIGVTRQAEAGAAGVVLNHAQELRRRGHTVECWFLEDIFDRPARPKRFEAVIFAVRVAKRILKKRKKYDVVNLHAPWGCVYGLWRKLLRPPGAPPYVLTMQGSEERYALAMRLEHRKGRAWNFGWKNRLWHRAYHQTMYDYSIKTADYGAVANREAWACAELKYGIGPGRICFVPNGTEGRFFIDRVYSEKSRIRLLYVGTWLDRKGVYYLADAVRSLFPKMPRLALTIAGCLNSEEYVNSFFEPELRDRIHILPFVKREAMPTLYSDHDIFVFPSLVEGMPLALLEAMAAAMPVITTATCGMADVVEDGINGILVPPANAEKLSRAILRLCNSVELRKQLGQEAQRMIRRYTWESAGQKLEQVFCLATQGGGEE